MKILLFYGLPCTGKSSIINELEKKGYYLLSVDNIIRKKIPTPTVEDFIKESPTIISELIHKISSTSASKITIEMGCLITKQSINILEEYLKNKKINFINIILTASNLELIQRAIQRNENIDKGLSDAIKINDPYDLQKFIDIFNENKPLRTISINTSSRTIKEIVDEVNTRANKCVKNGTC